MTLRKAPLIWRLLIIDRTDGFNLRPVMLTSRDNVCRFTD